MNRYLPFERMGALKLKVKTNNSTISIETYCRNIAT